MGRTAHVTSIEAIREFRQELLRYEAALREVLESFGLQTSRAVDWIEQDRARYWPAATRRAEDGVVAAKAQLQLAKSAALSNENKSCVDEKKLVERAVARLRLCEQKVKDVRSWRHRMRHGSEEFTAKLARLTHYLDVDLPRAVATLDHVIQALERYTDTKSTGVPSSRSSGTDGESS